MSNLFYGVFLGLIPGFFLGMCIQSLVFLAERRKNPRGEIPGSGPYRSAPDEASTRVNMLDDLYDLYEYGPTGFAEELDRELRANPALGAYFVIALGIVVIGGARFIASEVSNAFHREEMVMETKTNVEEQTKLAEEMGAPGLRPTNHDRLIEAVGAYLQTYDLVFANLTIDQVTPRDPPTPGYDQIRRDRAVLRSAYEEVIRERDGGM